MMVGENVILYFSVLVAAVFIRCLTLWVYRRRLSAGLIGDAAGHYSFIRAIIEQKGKYKGVPEWLIADRDDHYPILFHRFAALWGLPVLERYPFLPNVCVFALALIMFMTGMSWGFLGEGGKEPVTIALAVGLMFSLPGNLILTGDSILYAGLSERSMARLFTSLFFLGSYGFVTYEGGVALVYASICGGIALCTALFARQAILFVTVVWSVFQADANALLPLFGAILFAALIDRKYFFESIKDQFEFSYVYSRRMKVSKYWQNILSRFLSWRRVLSPRTSVADKREELEKREPTQSLFKCPEVYVVLFLSAAYFRSSELGEVVFLIIAVFFVYILISTPKLTQFGEAVRYPEYVLSMIAPAWIAVIWTQESLPRVGLYVLWGYLGFVALLVLLNLSRIREEAAAKDHWDGLRACLVVAGINSRHGVFTVPFSLGWVCSAATKCRSLTFQGVSFNVTLYDEFFEEFPFLKKDWVLLAKAHDLTHVVIRDAEQDAQRELLGWEYDFSALGEPITFDGFSVYRIPTELLLSSSLCEKDVC